MNKVVNLNQIKQYTQAIMMYDCALQINKNDAETYHNKGKTYYTFFKEMPFKIKENLIKQSLCMIEPFS